MAARSPAAPVPITRTLAMLLRSEEPAICHEVTATGARRSADPAPAGDRELPLEPAVADPVGHVEHVHAGAHVARDHLQPLADADAVAAVAAADPVLLTEEVHVQVGAAGDDQPVGDRP